MDTPLAITHEEWQEIMVLPRVKELWKLKCSDAVESFSGSVYGVKLSYAPTPFVIMGNCYIISSRDGEVSNVIIKRIDGQLIVEE